MTMLRILKRTLLLLFIAPNLCQSIPYYGAPLGSLQTISNDVAGHIFAVDEDTLFVKDFSYNGQSEDAVFWAGTSESPDINGFALTNETSEIKTIHPYGNHNVILRLPKGKDLKDIKWLSVWNRILSKSLGTLIFSKPILPPEPMAIGTLLNTKNGVSTGDILILDTQTFLIPNFSYDGSQKETYWWISVGKEPDERGVPLLENGSDAPLEETVNRTVVITLPTGHFVGDYETLSIWNRLDGDNYGYLVIPKNLNIPPSSRILGIKEPEMTDFNCEVLNDKIDFQVRWVIRGYDVIFHLIGNIGPNEYMALGLSKDDTETRFESADVMVAGLDANGNAFVSDYFFQSNQKCENGQGMCPDTIHGSENNLELLHAERHENTTEIIFKRHLRAEDKVYDQNIYTDGPQAILWAVGSLLHEGFIATPTFYNKRNLLMDFGRGPSWNCPAQQKVNHPLIYPEAKTQRIHCPGERSFRAQLGSSSRTNEDKIWFINGIPAPDLTVQRGITYTFIVEGGLKPPHHHPFYITANKNGGLLRDLLEANETLEVTFAGIEQDESTGSIFARAEGRLCDWTYSDISPIYEVLTSHKDVKPALSLKCEPGEPGKLIWTPTAETPNEVYYQSYTERNLGGKIYVVDFCEETNPHRYLEINTKGGKPKTELLPPKDEFERESEIDEYDTFLNMDDKISYVEETRVKHEGETSNKNNSTAKVNENYQSTIDKYTLSSNLMNSKINSDNHNGKPDGAENNKQIPESTPSPEFQVADNPDELFPHDESERSDIYLTHRTHFRDAANKATLNSHKNNENLAIKYPTHSASEVSSVPALGNQPSQEFKPHFEGGFVPLVMNPMKEKEFVQTKEFIHHAQQRSRPHRPFLYNESVPFHGTFKPGVPDFSGFNISNYSQEDASIILALNQENLSLLSASKPQPVLKPFSPFGTMPVHLLQRFNDQPPRLFQRPQDFGHRLHQLQQQPPLVGMRKNVFPQAPLNNKPNFPIPNVRDEDLTGISSQRVYVSMQATGDKNANIGNIPNLPGSPSYNRNQQNPPQNKMIYPPPIQRRPDFYEGKEINIQQPNVPPQRNFNAPHNSAIINNKHNQQKLNFPPLQSGSMQGQAIRQQIPNSKLPITRLQGQGEPGMIPQGPLRHPYPTMQVPQREIIPQGTVFHKGIPIRPQTDEKLKMVDGLANPQPNLGNRVPFPLHMMNNKEKVSQESKESQVPLVPSSSKEQKNLPQLVNAELVEVPTKNIPQTFTQENPAVNPILLMQKLPFNGSINAFSQNPNIRFAQIIPTMDQPKNLALFPSHPEKSVQNQEIASSEKLNNPTNHQTFQQQSSSERNQFVRENIQQQSQQKFDNHPSNFPQVGSENPSLQSSVPADMAFSKPTRLGFSTILDYTSEMDDSDRSDSVVSVGDYSSYNVPFGARLKFPQNGSKIPVRTLNETPKRPSGVIRTPQRNTPAHSDRNPNGSIKPVYSVTTSTTTTTTTTTRKPTTTTTTEATLIAMESKTNFAYNKQNTSEKDDYIEKLYYTPPVVSAPEVPTINSSTSFNQYSGPSNEVKHIPIIADTLDDIAEVYYPGRKNILPSNSNSAYPLFVVPPKISDDINLPHISENPPTHDNRTDYSILDHILTLIGSPPQQTNLDSSN